MKNIQVVNIKTTTAFNPAYCTEILNGKAQQPGELDRAKLRARQVTRTLEMKKTLIIALQILFFCSASIVSAEDQALENIVKVIRSALPKDWKVLSVESGNIPDWSFSDDKCWIVKVYGTNMSGYKYFDENGDYVGERKIFNEAMSIFNCFLFW